MKRIETCSLSTAEALMIMENTWYTKLRKETFQNFHLYVLNRFVIGLYVCIHQIPLLCFFIL